MGEGGAVMLGARGVASSPLARTMVKVMAMMTMAMGNGNVDGDNDEGGGYSVWQ